MSCYLENFTEKDSKCVNIANLVHYKICKENEKLCRQIEKLLIQNKELVDENNNFENGIRVFDTLQRRNDDFVFLLNGATGIEIVHTTDKIYTMTIPNANSSAKIFSQSPMHVVADICDIKTFEGFALAENAEEVETAIGAPKIDSFDEPIKTFLKEYETDFPFINENPSCTITLFGPGDETFHNISKLSDIKYDDKNDVTVLTLEITEIFDAKIPMPNEFIYDRVSIQVKDYVDPTRQPKKNISDIYIY